MLLTRGRGLMLLSRTGSCCYQRRRFILSRGQVSHCPVLLLLSEEGFHVFKGGSCCPEYRGHLVRGDSYCPEDSVQLVLQRWGIMLSEKVQVVEKGVHFVVQKMGSMLLLLQLVTINILLLQNIFLCLCFVKKKNHHCFFSSYFHFIFLFTENCGEP